MGPDDSNESRHSLPIGVGNDKRVDHKNKASSDCSVNVFWDPSRRKMVERSCDFNPQTAIRKNETVETRFIVRAIPNATLKELFVQMDFILGCEVTCDVRSIKAYQLESCGDFEPPPFCLSRIVRDEWKAWHKLWLNLGATENQVQCLILLDVEVRIHEEAEEIKVWSLSYSRSLQTVWIGNNKQSVRQIQSHYSKPIAEILSRTHQAPWTRARMWTIQSHEALKNAHGERHCPPLPQAMSIKNKGVLRVGVPLMQNLQRSSEVG